MEFPRIDMELEEDEMFLELDEFLDKNDIDPHWDAVKDYITDVSDFAEVQEIAVKTSHGEATRFVVKIAKDMSSGAGLKTEIYLTIVKVTGGDTNVIEKDDFYLTDGHRLILPTDRISEQLSTVYAMVRCRGGGKQVVKHSLKKKIGEKKTAISDINEELSNVSFGTDGVKAVADEAGAVFKGIYEMIERDNAMGAVEMMAARLSYEDLLKLQDYPSARPNERLNHLSESLVNGCVPKLAKAVEDLAMAKSSCFAVADYALTSALLRENGYMDWSALSQVVEFEKKHRDRGS